MTDIINPIFMHHKHWNKVVIVHFNGVHRVYKGNRRKNTDLYLTRNGQNETVKRLENFGYLKISEIEFNNYFNQNNQ
jgi:hypothetical protein